MLKLNEFSTSKKQGDAGLAVAISWFVLNGCTVCIPLTDSQDYDLVVEINNKLCKIQVKTGTAKKKENFKVGLRTRTTKDGKVYQKSFDKLSTDYLFIFTLDGEKYLIPSKDVENKNEITLYKKYFKYKIT